ncbi:oxidoreductase [Actinomadura sp. KC216]|uniref:group II truncated hemoglobin n=1 Tax=Actinomadura sp. KC216 TaxID=2530370 RepID=UPI0010524A28|nr:group II truncated hemoglobin [Actinomadura sp. KC216]TDB91952.1 oxidoreductase [Actinomadura sp. KC216]
MTTDGTPTLYDWAGGIEALDRLTEEFYRHVRKDELLAPLFQYMSDDHPHHVAMWLAEVFGGPTDYTDELGGFKRMIGSHKGKKIQPEQRKRWVKLMLEAADTVGLPADPEFRSAFVAYIEWGSRRAMANSQPDAPPSKRETVPIWGWGEAKPGKP